MNQYFRIMAASKFQSIPTEKLVKSRKTLLVIMSIPALLILVYGYFIFFSELESQMLMTMLPIIIIGGIFLPIFQLGQINAELKKRRSN